MRKSRSSYDNLSQLSSLKSLQRVRRRIARDIAATEGDMADQYQRAMDTFSYRNLIFALLSKADQIQAIVRYATEGFHMASGMASRRRCRK